MNIRKRRVLAALSAIALVAPLSLANPVSAREDNSSPGGTGNDINPQPASKIKRGGTMNYAQVTLCPQFNNGAAGGNLFDCNTVVSALLPSYTYFDGNGNLQVAKDYATSVKVSKVKGKQTVTYALNPKAVWSDGKSITAADFISMWKAQNGTNKAFAVISTTNYDKMESVVQGKTKFDVIVTYKETYADWQTAFSLLKPVSLTATPEAFNNSWKLKPSPTSGPFIWGGVDNTAKTITVKRNPKWWGDKPYLDRIVFKPLAQAAQIDALLNGEIDNMDVSVDANAVKRVRANKGKKVRLNTGVSPIFEHLTFGPLEGNAVTSDVAVRQALALALDRQQIATAILGPIIGKKNAAVLNNRIFMKGLYCNQDNSGSFGKRDLKAARALLDKAGWTVGSDGIRSKNGTRLSIATKYPSGFAPRRDIILLSSAMAKEVGIELVPTIVPSADYFVKHITQPANFELAVFAWVGTSFPIASTPNVYKTGSRQNFPKISSALVDSLGVKANQILALPKRCELMNQMDKELWKLMPNIPLYQRPQAIAVNKKLANFGAFGYTGIDWTKIGFTK
ncbi:MAG: ABC transporter family substrate-binding protein [Actinomycetota bacterium]|nr:ABC transporter family substrate-binding protein [Actinomycetota bacterium]